MRKHHFDQIEELKIHFLSERSYPSDRQFTNVSHTRSMKWHVRPFYSYFSHMKTIVGQKENAFARQACILCNDSAALEIRGWF